MRIKILVVILFVSFMAFISGCTSSFEHEDAEVSVSPFHAPHIPSESEAAFIAQLNETGLDWDFISAQNLIDPYHQAIPRNRVYIIGNPSLSANAIITLRNNAGTFWGDEHIHISFSPTGLLADDEKLLSDDEWLLFWKFAGEFLGEEEIVANIAARSLEYLEEFQFYDETENSIILMDGYEGNVDYRVILTWNIFYERYMPYRIALTAGLQTVYRGLLKELEELGGRLW
ncbi:MAG: hypothetical protein FWB80_04330 [Defluviitaleaceae bacterium]|nr:hypothetical protein [Defluviitaleaceae bacterium]